MSEPKTIAPPAAPTADGHAPRPRPQDGADEEAVPVIRLIEEWLADESGYDAAARPELKEALERNRHSNRKLFGG